MKSSAIIHLILAGFLMLTTKSEAQDSPRGPTDKLKPDTGGASGGINLDSVGKLLSKPAPSAGGKKSEKLVDEKAGGKKAGYQASKNDLPVKEYPSYGWQGRPEEGSESLAKLENNVLNRAEELRGLLAENRELKEKYDQLGKNQDSLRPTEYASQKSDYDKRSSELVGKINKLKEPYLTLKAQWDWNQLLIENKGYGPTLDEFLQTRKRNSSANK